MSTPLKQIFDMLMESQYWPPEQMLAYQRSQLAQLLRHAKATVPFYKIRLDAVFRKNGDIDWNRWNEIPIVTRTDLRDRHNEMLTSALPLGHGPTYEDGTSGSSGVPISLTQNYLFGWAAAAATYRAYTWHGFDYSLNFLDLQETTDPELEWPEAKSAGPWGPAWELKRTVGKKFRMNRATPERNIIEFIRRNKIRYLSSWPKTIQAICLAAANSGHDLKLDGVITRGTAVFGDERDDITRIAGAQILEQYSSTEAFNMASCCAVKKNLHINDEAMLLEIVDDQGLPCAVGQPGRVIVTPFFRTAQPLVRHEQGDIAVRGLPCSCGIALPTLEQISGRLLDMFYLPGGRKTLPALPVMAFTARFGAKTWQLAQVAPLEVELRFVKDATEPDYAYARSIITKTLEADVAIKFVELQKTPLTAGGKFLRYRCEIKP
jgi:phenylacetate-coenzyme A ligase PaaK-like adenylate-forming protein